MAEPYPFVEMSEHQRWQVQRSLHLADLMTVAARLLRLPPWSALGDFPLDVQVYLRHMASLRADMDIVELGLAKLYPIQP